MNPIGISWYLSAMFACMLVVSSAITYAPGAERFATLLKLSLVAFSLLLASAALLLRRWRQRGYPRLFFESRAFSLAYTVFAAVVTLLLLLGVIG
jgi:hypothetical protein